MDKEELKITLRCIRAKIQEKEFKAALKECQNLLKKDQKNYTALVFAGLCHTELSDPLEARQCYEKAISIDATQSLAWQGFCQYFEKFCIIDDNYCGCLRKVLLFTSDEDKKVDIELKLIKCLTKLKRLDEALKEMRKISALSQSQKLQEIDSYIIEVFAEETLLNESDLNLVLNSFQRTLDKQIGLNIQLSLRYANFLRKHARHEEAFNIVRNCYDKTPNEPGIIESICQLLIHLFLTNSGLSATESEVVENVLDGDFAAYCRKNDDSPCNVWLSCLEFVADYCSEEIFDAVESLEEISSTADSVAFVMSLLAVGHFALWDFKRALEYSRKALSAPDLKISLGDAKLRLRLVYLDSKFWISRQEADFFQESEDFIPEYESLLAHCQKFPNLTKLCHLSFLRAKCSLNEDQIFTGDDTNDLIVGVGQDDSILFESYLTRCWLSLLRKDFETSSNLAQKCIDLRPKDFRGHLLMGRILWTQRHSAENASDMADDSTKACFRTVAKLNPRCWEAFYYMALLQIEKMDCKEKALDDKQIAQRCLERAKVLNETNADVIKALSDLYVKMDLREKNVELLEKYAASLVISRSNLWAFQRLAERYTKGDKLEEAMAILQKISRIDPAGVDNWLKLANIYFLRGSLESAAKCAEKCVELRPDSLELKLKLAKIKGELENFKESSSILNEISIESNFRFIPAQIELARVYFKYAQKLYSSARYFEASDYCKNCVDILGRVLINFPDCAQNLSIAQKLLGDALTFFDNFSGVCLQNLNDSSLFRNTKSLTRLVLLETAGLFYLKTIKNRPRVAQFYLDLALNFLHRHKITQEGALLENAVKCAKKAVELEPKNSSLWLFLGFISSHNRDGEKRHKNFAQNCFVTALHLDQRNAIAWTNLGIFYMESFPNVELANECFKKAQIADPSYCNAWLGQAYIAERVKSSETMDLYRHATSLAYHPEALIGYASHVTSVLLNSGIKHSESEMISSIDHIECIPLALDSITKYLVLSPNDSCALNLAGILCEYENLLTKAAVHFEKAHSVLGNASEENEKKLTFTWSNLCRIYRKLRKRAKFDEISEDPIAKRAFSPYLDRALLYHSTTDFEKSFENYDYSLYYTKSPDDSFHIYIAQCFVALQWKGIKEALAMFAKKIGYTDDRFFARIFLLLVKLRGDSRKESVQLIKECLRKILEDPALFELERPFLSLIFQANSDIVDQNLILWIVHKLPASIRARNLFLSRCREIHKRRIACQFSEMLYRNIDVTESISKANFGYMNRRDMCRLIHANPAFYVGMRRYLTNVD